MTADIIAEDRNEEPVLYAEVKIQPASREDLERFTGEFLSADSRFSHGMLIDPEKMTVLRRDADHPDSVIELKTADVLSHYAPDFRDQVPRRGSAMVFHDYLRVLSEVWLDDLAFHWKSESPPGADALSRIGLLERLKDGSTRIGVISDGDRLR
jgi:hypothetical protein